MELDEEHSYSVNSSCTTGYGDVKWTEFDCVIQTFMKEQDIPGASVAICKNREIIYTQGYGSAGGSKRVSPDSFFRIASISKPITAFAILHLCTHHDVNLDSKVFGRKGILRTYKYKDKRVPAITIRHLLQHSAGWDRDMAGDVAFVTPASVARCDPESVEHNHALLSYVLKKRLQFKPGTRHAYSNMCYLVLGLVIEGISGVSFASYLSQVFGEWSISGIRVGSPWRADWACTEVEYFNNRDPTVVPSLHNDFGDVLPQYGGLAMASAAAYGGLVANGISLLHFINVIENLVATECEDHAGDRNDQLREMVAEISILVKESLRRPDYESGCDWYCLGWDVQDKGKSWGHTGGMEGTSCILFHHVSGLSWTLLLNAWAKDIDLNGVMKCAISRVASLNLFDCDVRLLGEMDGFRESDSRFNELGRGRVLFSRDQSQVIVIGVEETAAYGITLFLKEKGYVLGWISVVKNELDFYANSPCDVKTQSAQFNNPFRLTYILVFSGRNQQYDDYVVIVNKSKNDLMAFIKERESMGYIMNFIDSFCDFDGNIRFSAVLIKVDKSLNDNSERSLHLGVRGSTYAHKMKLWGKSHNVLCQSVTEVGNELFVSSLLERRKSIDENNAVTSIILYWIQIEPESFLTELNRKIKQNMNLMYAKFFNSKGQPWVSACWTSGRASNIYHRISMSKYGIFPELAEAAAENIQLLSVSEYEDDGVIYYAGLWKANE